MSLVYIRVYPKKAEEIGRASLASPEFVINHVFFYLMTRTGPTILTEVTSY